MDTKGWELDTKVWELDTKVWELDTKVWELKTKVWEFFTRRISLLLRQFTTASIRLLVYYSTFYVKTTILLDCSRPSHPSSRGYLGQVQQGEIRFHVWQRLTIGIGWAE